MCVHMLKALHGSLMASIFCHNKCREDIEVECYKVNSCDVCVVNKTTKGKQYALTWHADDSKASHADIKVNEKFYK